MTVKSKPYFWVVCDHDGCAERSPSAGYEITAWCTEGDAITQAEEDDFAVNDAGEHYCPEHRDDALTPAERDAIAKEDAEIDKADAMRKGEW
jgi:hypothetical protein